MSPIQHGHPRRNESPEARLRRQAREAARVRKLRATDARFNASQRAARARRRDADPALVTAERARAALRRAAAGGTAPPDLVAPETAEWVRHLAETGDLFCIHCWKPLAAGQWRLKHLVALVPLLRAGATPAVASDWRNIAPACAECDASHGDRHLYVFMADLRARLLARPRNLIVQADPRSGSQEES